MKEKTNEKKRTDKYEDRYSEEMDDAMDGEGKRGGRNKYSNKKKECRFTAGEEDVANISYKNPRFLGGFMTEHGKIVPRRVTGNCAYVQRQLAQEIKRARVLALVGYVSVGPNQN